MFYSKEDSIEITRELIDTPANLRIWYPVDSLRHFVSFVLLIVLICFLDAKCSPDTLLCGSASNLIMLIFLYNMDLCPELGYYAVYSGFNALMVSLVGVVNAVFALRVVSLDMEEGMIQQDRALVMTEECMFDIYWHLGIIAVTLLLSMVYLSDRAKASKHNKGIVTMTNQVMQV